MAATESKPVEEWVLKQVDERTSPDPDCDHCQMVEGNLWSSRKRLLRDGGKFSCPHPEDEVKAAVNRLVNQKRLIQWHGLLAPANDEHLRAIIECETNCDITRRILVGKVNEYLSGEEGGAGE